uniref:Arsenite methyltransferase n=1 Tax=Terrapene triunguis TaxID=2587831 RepID=A0A674I8E7_9SAUR
MSTSSPPLCPRPPESSGRLCEAGTHHCSIRSPDSGFWLFLQWLPHLESRFTERCRYYGCGLVIPECLETCWILDLGSGSGRDCYMLSKLVGEKGHVTGIDMTDAQVEVAKKHVDYHMKKFGYQVPNVDFIHGYMEKLGDAGLKDESYDIVISNGVINLSPDKRAVLQEAYRVLKAGGEMYFSDVYASCDLPEDIRKHRVLWGECLGGALWWKDLYRLAEEVGFCPPRLVTASRITINNKELESVVGDCQFVSATFRLFKVPKKGPAERCQVIYNGGITGHEKELEFDANFTFKVQGSPPGVVNRHACVSFTAPPRWISKPRARGSAYTSPSALCDCNVAPPAAQQPCTEGASSGGGPKYSNAALSSSILYCGNTQHRGRVAGNGERLARHGVAVPDGGSCREEGSCATSGRGRRGSGCRNCSHFTELQVCRGVPDPTGCREGAGTWGLLSCKSKGPICNSCTFSREPEKHHPSLSSGKRSLIHSS